MAFGNPRDDGDDEVMGEINMTPLVDVMLVLLIIFIVTMPVLTHSVPLQLPQAAGTPQPPPAPPLELAIAADGRYFLDRQEVTRAALAARLQAAAALATPPPLRISADRDARYDAVAQALAAAQSAGLRQVGMVMQP